MLHLCGETHGHLSVSSHTPSLKPESVPLRKHSGTLAKGVGGYIIRNGYDPVLAFKYIIVYRSKDNPISS